MQFIGFPLVDSVGRPGALFIEVEFWALAPAVQVVLRQINIFLQQLTQNMTTDFRRFTQIVQNKRAVLNFRTICVNLRKSDENPSSYFGLIGDKIC